jgi:hypothetical protein
MTIGNNSNMSEHLDVYEKDTFSLKKKPPRTEPIRISYHLASRLNAFRSYNLIIPSRFYDRIITTFASHFIGAWLKILLHITFLLRFNLDRLCLMFTYFSCLSVLLALVMLDPSV